MTAEPQLSKSASKKIKKHAANGSVNSVQASKENIDPASKSGEDLTLDNEAGNGNGDSPYVRELHKNIRNLNKKLAGMSKVDAVVSENPGVSLDDLVAARKINMDQKAQALKKPQLQANVAQLEDQLAHYKKFEDEFKARFAAEKALLETAHLEELEKVERNTKAAAIQESGVQSRKKLLVLSQFLRAAAARRQMDDGESEDSKGFEGVLLLLYGGDAAAVDASEKLIAGASDGVPSTEGTLLQVTYDRIKQLSIDHEPATDDDVEAGVATELDGTPNVVEAGASISDPTVTHATLGEQADGAAPQQAEPVEELADSPAPPGQGTFDTSQANTAANQAWEADGQAGQNELESSWVSIPRPAGETESPQTTAGPGSTQAWADDPAPLMMDRAQSASTTQSDAFTEVHHGRGGRSRGQHSDQRGGGRGRGGYRGDGGRGRGGFRGDRGGGRGRGRGAPRGGAPS